MKIKVLTAAIAALLIFPAFGTVAYAGGGPDTDEPTETAVVETTPEVTLFQRCKVPDADGFESSTVTLYTSVDKLCRQYRKIELLILDEWLLYPLKDTEARDLLELVEDRYRKASTIFCSQFDVGGWHGKIGQATLADAVVDRIVHDSYTIKIEGEDSMRKHKGLAAKGGTESA